MLTTFAVGSLEKQASTIARVVVQRAGAIATVEAWAAVASVDDQLAQEACVTWRAGAQDLAVVGVAGAVVLAHVMLRLTFHKEQNK